MSDFRDRYGRALGDAARELGGADLRDRLGAALGLAATTLAADAEREPAATGPSQRGERGRRPAHRWLPRISRPLAIGLALLTAGTAAAAAVWLPTLGDTRYGYNPGVDTSAPPPAELGRLAVLRRAQSDADRGPLAQTALTDIGEGSIGVRTAYVRLLAADSAGAFVLVPVAERRATATGPAIADALCVYHVAATGPDAAAPICWSLAEVEAGTAIYEVGDQVFGLVPDGVAAVTVALANGDATTATVRDNAYVATLAGGTGPLPQTDGPVKFLTGG